MSDYSGRIISIAAAKGSAVDDDLAAADVTTTVTAYNYGHRVARHAAAEIAVEADRRIAQLEAQLAAANARIEQLEDALRPFAAMDRLDCDLSKVACIRGTASDLTLITSGDFRKAADALGDEFEDLANNMPDEFGD